MSNDSPQADVDQDDVVPDKADEVLDHDDPHYDGQDTDLDESLDNTEDDVKNIDESEYNDDLDSELCAHPDGCQENSSGEDLSQTQSRGSSNNRTVPSLKVDQPWYNTIISDSSWVRKYLTICISNVIQIKFV